jgi:DNA-binding CsgD family transcriptional regulator
LTSQDLRDLALAEPVGQRGSFHLDFDQILHSAVPRRTERRSGFHDVKTRPKQRRIRGGDPANDGIQLKEAGLNEAVELLASAGDADEIASVYAEVMIAAGHPDRAVAVLRPRLTAMGSGKATFPSMAAVLVDAYLARGDLSSADAAASSLREAGSEHPQALALMERATGLVAAVQGELNLAANRLRSAAAEFDRLELPFHAARTRFELPRVVSMADPSLAMVEASWALNRLQGLGAHREAAWAAALLRDLGVATKPGPRHIGLLSQREREVLTLLKRGLTNPEIAAELFISPKTVAHHVSRILAKLNLRSHAEAAAYAAASDAVNV